MRASIGASPTITSESGVASLILASCTRKSVSAMVNDSLATGVTPFSFSRSTTRLAIPSPKVPVAWRMPGRVWPAFSSSSVTEKA